MQRLYIIDSTLPVSERIVNTMTCLEGAPQYVDYMDVNITLEDYKTKLNNPNLIALTWEEFEPRLLKYKDSLCLQWVAISKEDYFDLLECVTPRRWRNILTAHGMLNVFAVGECYTIDLHTHCVMFGGRHFKTLAPIGVDNTTFAKKIY